MMVETATKSVSRQLLLLIAVLVFSTLVWMAVRRMRDLMMLGYVDSAIGRVRTVAAAEEQFAKAHPEIGYTCSLSQLPHDELITGLVAKNQKYNGYLFEIVGCKASAPKKPNLIYQITARPLRSGLPAFCSDDSGIVKSDYGGSVEKCLANGVPLGN